MLMISFLDLIERKKILGALPLYCKKKNSAYSLTNSSHPQSNTNSEDSLYGIFPFSIIRHGV
jgi:hypothetical protein